MSDLKETTLILAAHGSDAAADSNAPVAELASEVGDRELFAKVTPAFLYGAPDMSCVLDEVATEKVVVVPLMTSAGYYLNSVIPKRLAKNKEASQRRWFISSVAGMHGLIGNLMIDRISGQLEQHDLDASQTTIALIGHGTRRNRNSAKSTFALFEKLKDAFPEARNRVAFLDQDPEAPLVAASIVEGHTIVVPFLISRGPHTTVDVPEAFGLAAGPEIQFPLVEEKTARGGVIRKMICEEPLAYYPEMVDICIELATEAIENDSTLELPELETA
jgi:sirohydrochlorin cobaltochelatase